jgi:hypothetical protein
MSRLQTLDDAYFRSIVALVFCTVLLNPGTTQSMFDVIAAIIISKTSIQGSDFSVAYNNFL